ncbi:MAG: S-adenosyl-l-methionine hydroxide adenosyltransferase family protein [Candidatus Binataceae bacterium]
MPPRSQSDAPIAILTDFGYRDHYVGVMKGVIASIAPKAAIIDLTHGVPPQSIVAGAIALGQSWRFFPKRTIFLAVVDPGVGTPRLPIAIETRAGACFVGPDNGLLSLAAEAAGMRRIVRLESPRYRLAKTSSTFHGRDVFAPAAAFIASGTPLARLGPTIGSIQQLDLPKPAISRDRVRGEVIYIDGYGNLVTNITRESIAGLTTSFPGKPVSVRIETGALMKIFNTYGDAPAGTILATFGSFELLEIAARNGSAAERVGCGLGARVVARVTRA